MPMRRKRFTRNIMRLKLKAAGYILSAALAMAGVITLPSSSVIAAESYSASAAADGVSVTAEADNGVLPEDAQLNIRKIEKNDKGYEESIKKIKEKEKKYASSALYDISFTADGKEIEPDGEVKISMKWDNSSAPEGESETPVLYHIGDKETARNTSAEADTENGKLQKLAFTSSSFSVFAVVWRSEGERFAGADLHLADASGTELAASVSLSDSDLASGDVITLSEYAEKDGTSAVSGYSYVQSCIGSSDGTAITGLKGEKKEDTEGKTYYCLYTTADADPASADASWIQYKDNTGENENSADIWMIFEKSVSVK